ncbi:MAG: prephenate dehydratase [Solirubrobacteraceae bacterium]|nr:prephenate dehydratase [Solirubrobacteraceae bacterium]
MSERAATEPAPAPGVAAGRPIVGFLGPAGTFSEVAAERLTASWAGERRPIESIINVIQGVAAGGPTGGPLLDAAVVPIENSTEGSVGATLDTLVEYEDLVITAELDLPIEQLLVARTELALDQIEQVYSHPQGVAQARRFLAEHVPQAGVVPVSSTSRSVELIAGSTEPWAAIGSRRAAELYGAVILRDDIQELVNVTRFVLIERRDAPVDRDPDPAASPEESAAAEPRRRASDEEPMKTTLVFRGSGDGSPGWLVRCLSEFAFRGVNLSKIESRPLRGQLGHYRFFIDLEGADSTPEVAAAIEGLRHHCSEVRSLGSYPVAADPV